MTSRDPVSNQLTNYYKNHGNLESATTSAGNPLPYMDSSVTLSKFGLIPLQDFELIDQLTHFARERIPERVVHAKGGGASGFFEVTHDITKWTVAKPFQSIGRKTQIRIRFSIVAPNVGGADTVRDPRGFAIKFFTDDGIWDLVGNNTPIFFIRDPILFPHFIHSQKRNPVTNTRDWDAFWDFISLRPETVQQMMILFSDRGIPDGFRHMHGFGSHTFSMINKDKEINYCKFHIKTNQGIKNLDVNRANELAASDPDYSLKDLYNAIERGDYPSWTMYVQIMSETQANQAGFDAFDLTKVWPQDDYPLHPVGKLTLNRNPENYFAEIEQIAFTPSNLIPGIAPSRDRVLQARLFSYHDAHIYRLGANYNQLPVNCPFAVRNYQRDGTFATNNQGGAPNYHPNSFGGPESNERAYKYYPRPQFEGQLGYYDLKDEDNFSQARVFYEKVLRDDERQRLVQNISNDLRKAREDIQNRTVQMFSNVSEDFGKRLKVAMKPSKTANV